MTSWLITEDSRFAAAVSVSPHTNQISAHLLSNIPNSSPRSWTIATYDAAGKYFTRSAVVHAQRVPATVRTIFRCGTDRRSPPPAWHCLPCAH